MSEATFRGKMELVGEGLYVGSSRVCVEFLDRAQVHCDGNTSAVRPNVSGVVTQELGRSAAGEENTKKDHGVCGDGFTALASTALNQSSGSTSWTPGLLNQGTSIQPGRLATSMKSPMTSLMLTDNSQLTADGFEE
uniref:(California timema) hypothetical protein n=1 Tax=Timema californicum TaxID=61474 RepID=A0A7R9JDL1_TIMCA|nr:unnamed protein product [Timema californicum]